MHPDETRLASDVAHHERKMLGPLNELAVRDAAEHSSR